MKLIIDISEGSYNAIKECYERGELLTTIYMQIATGTPYEESPQCECQNYIHKYKCDFYNENHDNCKKCGMRGEYDK